MHCLSINVISGKLGSFPQYSNLPGSKDRTGNKELTLLHFKPMIYGNRVFSDWQGLWGYKETQADQIGGMLSHDGPPGPPFRAAINSDDKKVNLLNEPVFLHNRCIRNDAMVDQNYRDNLRIGE